MEVIAQQVRQFSPILYIACAIGFVTFAFVGIASLRDYRKAVFRMERSSVGSRVSGAWMRAVLCALAGVAIYFVTNIPASTSNRRNIVATLIPTSTAPGLILPTSLPTVDYSNPAPVITPTFVIGVVTEVPTNAQASDNTLINISTDIITATVTVTEASNLNTVQPPVITVSAEGTTAAIQTVVAQNAPAVSGAVTAALKTPTRLPSPTSALLATAAPNKTAIGSLATPTIAAQRIATAVPIVATLPPIPTAAPIVAGPPLPSPDCADPGSVGITSPRQGDTISGQRGVIGNAGFANDGSYAKLEIMPQEGGGWRFLNKLEVGVRDGPLGGVNSAYLSPGTYFLRLLIVDKDGHEIKICRVSIRVE